MTNSTPLEALFDIAPGSTPTIQNSTPLANPSTELIDPTTGEIIQRSIEVTPEELQREDRIEDLKIDGQLETVHSMAMQAFYAQHAMSQAVDPKFSARNSEVAAQYLSIALNATSARVKSKYERQKIRMAQQMGNGPTTVNQNLIVANRNDLLKSLFSQDFEKTLTEQLKDDMSSKL